MIQEINIQGFQSHKDTRMEFHPGVNVIVGESGMFIVKTLGVRPRKVTSFDDAQQEIDRKLRDEQFNSLGAKYYRKLREKAVIVQAEAFEQTVLVRAMQLHYSGR